MPTPRGVAQEENAVEVRQGGAKPKAVQKPAHPWYWYLTPAGIQMNQKFHLNQLFQKYHQYQ